MKALRLKREASCQTTHWASDHIAPWEQASSLDLDSGCASQILLRVCQLPTELRHGGSWRKKVSQLLNSYPYLVHRQKFIWNECDIETRGDFSPKNLYFIYVLHYHDSWPTCCCEVKPKTIQLFYHYVFFFLTPLPIPLPNFFKKRVLVVHHGGFCAFWWRRDRGGCVRRGAAALLVAEIGGRKGAAESRRTSSLLVLHARSLGWVVFFFTSFS